MVRTAFAIGGPPAASGQQTATRVTSHSSGFTPSQGGEHEAAFLGAADLDVFAVDRDVEANEVARIAIDTRVNVVLCAGGNRTGGQVEVGVSEGAGGQQVDVMPIESRHVLDLDIEGVLVGAVRTDFAGDRLVDDGEAIAVRQVEAVFVGAALVAVLGEEGDVPAELSARKGCGEFQGHGGALVLLNRVGEGLGAERGGLAGEGSQREVALGAGGVPDVVSGLLGAIGDLEGDQEGVAFNLRAFDSDVTDAEGLFAGIVV